MIVRFARNREDSSGNERRRLWRYFALGGAGLGAAGVSALALASCDAGCRDDGAVGLPAYIIGGALIGGAVGAVVGLIVDSARGSP